MSAPTRRAPTVLSLEDVERFQLDGYLIMKGAFSREHALAMQDEIWSELKEEFGIDRADRSTWTTTRHGARGESLPGFELCRLPSGTVHFAPPERLRRAHHN